MEQTNRDKRSSFPENENWENQNRYRYENDYDQQRNYEGNYGNEDYRRENDYGRNENDPRYRNRSGGEINFGKDYSQSRSSNSGSDYGRRYGYSADAGRWPEDDYGGNDRNRQYGRFDRDEDYRRGMSGNYGRNRNYDPNIRNQEDDRGYRKGQESRYGNQDRNWWDKTTDEVSSWFGDEDAERRRRMDSQQKGEHRGKGPKDYHRSQERIMEDVCDRLCDDSYVDASGIEVKVNGSDVILTGTVDNKEAKRRAEDVVESVSGVTNVQNQLRIGQQIYTTSSQEKTVATGNAVKPEKMHHN